MTDTTEELIFVTWALGPSYRYRLKQFIKHNLSTDTCNNVRYLIFTDDVSYFDYLRNQTDIPIIDIINIFDFIESNNIEMAQDEYLPRTSDTEWARESRQFRGQFSYPAKRVIFLKLYELGITKFALIDPDVHVSRHITKEQLYNGLDIPPDSVSVMGRVPLEVIYNPNSNKLEVSAPASMDTNTTLDFYRAAYFLMYMIRQRVQDKYGYDIPLKHHAYYKKYDLSEGIFHYYHFSSKEKMLQYYQVCDETVRFLYSTEYKSVTQGPGWLIPDFTVLSLTNALCEITSYDADRPLEMFFGMVYYEDKFALPNVNGLLPGDTLEEFAEINKEMLNREYFNRDPRAGYWNFLRDFNIIDLQKYNEFFEKHPQFKELAKEYYDPSWLLKRD